MITTGMAEQVAIVSAGIFFLAGLLTGVWKYLQIRASERARAHYYVDVAHRASLMYSFAALLLAVFASISTLSERVELWAVLVQVVFFALAIGAYVVHGALGDTSNQLRRPHRLGARHVPPFAMTAFMAALVLAEVGGFLVLFFGVLRALGLA